jgi:hypothetical protein
VRHKRVKGWAVLRVYENGSWAVFDTRETRKEAESLRRRVADDLKARKCRWCVARVKQA